MTFQKGHKPLGRALKGHVTSEETKRKISENKIRATKISNTLKGRTFSHEHKEKLSKNHADFSGQNNPMYGKKRIQYKGKNSPFYKNGIKGYRQRALEALGKKCNRCPIIDERLLLAHHKDRNRKNNELSNFEILCRNCHTLEHLKSIN